MNPLIIALHVRFYPDLSAVTVAAVLEVLLPVIG